MTPTQKRRDRKFIGQKIRSQQAKVMGAMMADGVPAAEARQKAAEAVHDWWARHNETCPEEHVVSPSLVALGLRGKIDAI